LPKKRGMSSAAQSTISIKLGSCALFVAFQTTPVSYIMSVRPKNQHSDNQPDINQIMAWPLH
jgi:hypothetical protein